MTNPHYAEIARLADLSADQAEQWCHSREVSADEAQRIWIAAAGNAAIADSIWYNDDFWTDATDATDENADDGEEA